MISFIGIILMLAALGFFTVIALLVAFAIVKNRPALAALAGILMFLVVGVALVFVGLFSYRGQVVQDVEIPVTSSHVSFEHHLDSSSTMPNWANTAIHLSKFIVVLALASAIVGIISLVRWLKSRNTSNQVNDGERRGLPAFALILIITIVLFGSIRFRLSSDAFEAAAQAQRQAAEVARQMAEQQNAANQLARANGALAKASEEVIQQYNASQKGVAEMDIHQLMDKFDAPRIYLPPLSPGAAFIFAPLPAMSSFQAVKQAAATASQSPETPAIPAVPSISPSPPIAAVSSVSTKAETPEGAASETVVLAENPVTASKPATPQNVLPRPKWVDAPPETVGGKWSRVIVAGEFVTDEECQAETNRLITEAVNEYVCGFPGGASLLTESTPQTRLAKMGIGVDYIRNRIAKPPQYWETVERSVGPMKKVSTRLEIASDVDHDLRYRWNAARRGERFWLVGAGVSSILGLVGVALGLLKVDTMTRGYYTKRLFVGVPAAIIGFIALLAFLR